MTTLPTARFSGTVSQQSEHCCLLQVRDNSIIVSGIFVDTSSLLVTLHASASIAVWFAATGRQIAFFACDSAICHLTCSPRGMLALGTQSGLVHFLQLPVETDVAAIELETTGAPLNCLV